jgi:hypothetical protein
MTLFLDCDGVLAGFDEYGESLFGMPPREYETLHGQSKFWTTIEAHEDFYFKLPVRPDGQKLYDAVKHLNPIILTGCPDDAEWSRNQKLRWAEKHFPETKMICVPSPDKRIHSKPGDILIDDYLKYKDRWIEWGGIFIHYQNTDQALRELSIYESGIIE